ncbi:MAG: MFS transporter, partial [Candidatus Sumerlaeota bacterium]|nr:MFS transporter [Candidatus Sumerlaeota bacterium]
MSVVEPEIAAPLNAAPALALIPRAGWVLILVLCSLIFGISVTEAVSNNLLPLTLRRFTTDPRIIGYILAINPAFGFIAQPLVGVLSDHVWTPLGRRALFLIIGSPIVAACLIGVPWCATLLPIVVLVVIYQFFEDVLYGSDHPLIADLVPPEQRSFVAGAMATAGGIATIFVLRAGLPLVDAVANGVHRQIGKFALQFEGLGVNAGEFSLYAIAAAAQILFVCVAAFCLHERPQIKQPRPKLTIARYITDLVRNPMLLRLALVNFFKSVQANAVSTYVVLYATDTLLFTKGDFGKNWSWGALVGPILALVVGLSVERFRKNYAMIAGFVVAITGYAMGFFSHSLLDLAIVGVVIAIGEVIQGVTHKAFMTEYMPRDLTGQLSGAINIFYATGRTLSVILMSQIVYWYSRLRHLPEGTYDYRIIWVCAAIVGLANIAILLTVRDERSPRPVL